MLYTKSAIFFCVILFIFLSSSANGINKNELKRFKSTPTLIIFPKSITGLISLKIKEAKPTIVVNAVKRHGMKISDKDDVDFGNWYNSSSTFINRAGGVQKGFSGDHLNSAQTPSYPSGHTIQAYVVALYLSDQFPEVEEELLKIREFAPKSNVYCRLQVYNGGAQWPLSKKFGCSSKELEHLLIKARKIGLNPLGLSFHVGSQQLSKQTWEKAIKTSSQRYKKFKKKYFVLSFLNIGGGMPEN